MAPDDERLPAAAVLLGSGSHDLVAAAVGAHGGELLSLQRRQAVYKPRRSLVVRYSAEVRWGAQAPTNDTFVAVADRKGPPEGTLILEADDMQVGLFRYPFDPALPGLADATTPNRARDLLGVDAVPHLEAKTYRPCDRAVVRADVGRDTFYLKVKKPAEIAEQAERLRVLGRAAPVPPVVRADADLGVLVLGGLPGETLRDRMRDGRTMGVDPDTLLGALDGLTAAAPADGAPVRSAVESAHGHARLLATLLPSSRRRIERLCERLGRDDTEGTVAVHGDFHPAQVLVEDGRLSGLLDVDDLGLGRPVDDLATFLGHLANLALDDRTGAIRAELGRCLVAFEDRVDPEDLHRHTAAVLIGLATGPHRVQHQHWRYQTQTRLGLAERWLNGEVRTLRLVS